MPLIIHRGGKLLPDVTYIVYENVYHLVILVTGEGTEKLFGIPNISKGAVAAIAETTVASLVEWGIKEQVIGCVLIQILSTVEFIKELVH